MGRTTSLGPEARVLPTLNSQLISSPVNLPAVKSRGSGLPTRKPVLYTQISDMYVCMYVCTYINASIDARHINSRHTELWRGGKSSPNAKQSNNPVDTFPASGQG